MLELGINRVTTEPKNKGQIFCGELDALHGLSTIVEQVVNECRFRDKISGWRFGEKSRDAVHFFEIGFEAEDFNIFDVRWCKVDRKRWFLFR